MVAEAAEGTGIGVPRAQVCLSDQSSSRAGWLHPRGDRARRGSKCPGASPACKQPSMVQEVRTGVAGGAQAAALAGSIPSRDPRGVHAARPSAAGRPVRLRATG